MWNAEEWIPLELLHVGCSSCPQLYILMGDRLRELCEMLRIPDELRLKIWTCFEYSLVHCTRLMEDRHLDQLLLCAIYIMSKVSRAGLQSRSCLTVRTRSRDDCVPGRQCGDDFQSHHKSPLLPAEGQHKCKFGSVQL